MKTKRKLSSSSSVDAAAVVMKPRSKQTTELFWPRVVVRKLLNITAKDSDYSADSDSDSGSGSDSDPPSDSEEIGQGRSRAASRFGRENREGDAQIDPSDALPRSRRRKSETFRAQYINTKELRVRVATWNVGGKLPPDDLDIDDWVNTHDPADIYVLGLQEIVPLNAGNIFGAEDNRPVPKWENIVRDTLNRIRPMKTKVKCYSDPASPSKFYPSDEVLGVEEELILESDSDIGEEVHPLDDDSYGIDETKDKLRFGDGHMGTIHEEVDLERQTSRRRLDRMNCIRNEDESPENLEESVVNQQQQCRILTRVLSGSERIGLSWPEQPLNLLSQHSLQRPGSFKSIKTFTATKSFGRYNSFKSVSNDMQSGLALLTEIDLESLLKRKRRSSYVRIVSKQMVGVFVTIWVRRSLRKHIQNVKVSTVGVGVMGYIGNKGSISVSMSVYQTPFCFVCSHLTSGEKDGDELKRNADVYEIHRRTHFHSISGIGLPKSIKDHERVIWLGDLNYRINLSYDRTRELIARKEWSKLAEYDQLTKELRKGRAFDGWREGKLVFPPTYKYELNSDRYYGEDPKAGRRTPAWCDRILSRGKGFRLLNYRRTELKFSDHRPVSATYMVEVEVFCPKKLQRALTITDAEIENEEVEIGIDIGMSYLQLDKLQVPSTTSDQVNSIDLYLTLNSSVALPSTMFLLKTWRQTAFGVFGYMNFTKSAFLEHAKQFKPEDMEKRIDGKNCVVTGANSGIGYATAEGLASRWDYLDSSLFLLICLIHLKICVSFDLTDVFYFQWGDCLHGLPKQGERGSCTFRNPIFHREPKCSFGVLYFSSLLITFSSQVCDLSSINDIKSFAARFSSKEVPVHVLVNNAGLLENSKITTSEGFELNFAVNVLGTYTMTELMRPMLEKAAPDSRVITVSSGGMYTTPLTTDLQFSDGNFDGVAQYARNKRAQVALTENWAEMYKDKGISFYSMHPGWAETPGVAKSLPSFNERFAGKLRTKEEGADTVVWLALQPKEKLTSGAFYFDRAEAPKHLTFSATKGSHALIGSIVDALRSLAKIS
ncbi:unnamed protein product [Linum tenue]|uniref:Inositol polyphosphate-related phosphatase domain-containing protein n=1 Tax=Linum tenue TaxID=586396 RepID=A0AAV0IFR9_9ROSI|nr:unnamed protein product [Linum tenue]